MVQLTYHCNLKGNKEKLEFLEQLHKCTQIVARYILWYIKTNKEYRRTELYKATCKKIKEKYPFFPAKLVQHIIFRVLLLARAKKLYKIKKLNIPLIFDYQNFNIEFKEAYYNGWVRFCKTNYPLEGLRTINKLKEVANIKEIQIKKISNNWRIYFICEVPERNNVKGNQKLGIDININNIILSNGKRFNLKRYVHKKIEYRKHKNKDKIVRFSKDFFHKTTSKLVKSLVETGGSQIILENLTNIRRSSSRKEGTSKGKNVNYLINNVFPFRMFQSFLEYKCKLNGIEVKYINPKNTSKTCSFCGSLDTNRPKQSLLICNSCGRKLNADLNGAKNILGFSSQDGPMTAPTSLSSLNKQASLRLWPWADGKEQP
jgi:IS605 OrfB family transposase